MAFSMFVRRSLTRPGGAAGNGPLCCAPAMLAVLIVALAGVWSVPAVGWAAPAGTGVWEAQNLLPQSSSNLFSPDFVGAGAGWTARTVGATLADSAPSVADTTAPTTTSDAVRIHYGSAVIRLSATDDFGGSGVAFTRYRLDGALSSEGTTVSVSAIGPHMLEFWSVDNAGNIETTKSAEFTLRAPLTVPSLSNPVASATMSSLEHCAVYGYLKPLHAVGTYPVRIYKWRKTASGMWQSYGYTTARASNYSSWTRYSTSFRLTGAGVWRLRAYALADGAHVATWSGGYAYVTVKVPVVVIDAGHQAIRNTHLEPIGPGSKTLKPASTFGTTGRFTHVPEYRMNLQVALKLRDVLVKQGVKVIMVRTSNNVNIANSQRARIANVAHAALFIRLHGDGSTNSSVHGISVLTPGKNRWTAPIVTASIAASKLVSREVIKSTKATNRGITPRTDLAGFNWCTVPSVLVEMGFMSNRTEDKLLATSAYQNKLAAGLALGALDYLSGN